MKTEAEITAQLEIAKNNLLYVEDDQINGLKGWARALSWVLSDVKEKTDGFENNG